MLTKYGVFIKKEEFVQKNSLKLYKKITADLTIKTIVDKYRNIIKTAKLIEYDKSTDNFIVPRFIGFKMEASGFINIKNYINPKEIKISAEKLTFTPTPNQEIIVKYLLANIYNEKNINNGSAGCVLNLSAGQGKTYIAAYLAHLFNTTTLIIVPNETLLNQTVAVLKQVFPNKIIGTYYCKYKFIGHINVMIIDSVINNDEFLFYDLIAMNENYNYTDEEINNMIDDIEFVKKITHFDTAKKKKAFLIKEKYLDYFKRFNFVIYDEIHEYCGSLNRKAFTRAQGACVLGLTASPNERPDKFDKIARFYIGPLINAKEIAGYQLSAFNFTSSYYPIIYNCPVQYANNHEIYNDMLNELIIDPYRTKLIVNLVKDLILENRNIFIFTERRKHAAIIKLAMQKHIAINAINLMEEEGEKEVENDDGEEDGDEIEDDENDGDENNIEVENEVINNEIEIGGENDEAINNENVDEDELENKNNVNAYGEVIDKDFEKYLINSNFLNNKASILIGGVTAESERISEQNSNVIIATYHYLSTGRSIKKMDTIILAMPRKSKMLQTFGRIFRLNGDEKIHRKIYDIVDNMHKVKAQYYHRKKIAMEEYKSNVETKVVYNYDQII